MLAELILRDSGQASRFYDMGPVVRVDVDLKRFSQQIYLDVANVGQMIAIEVQKQASEINLSEKVEEIARVELKLALEKVRDEIRSRIRGIFDEATRDILNAHTSVLRQVREQAYAAVSATVDELLGKKPAKSSVATPTSADGHRAVFCGHTNEVPMVCPCLNDDCYCKTNTCRGR